MEVAPEVLFGGIGVGFGGMALGMRVIYSHLKATFESRITALEKALSEAKQFERQTLIDLLTEALAREQEHSRLRRRLERAIETLRARYGDGVAMDAHDAIRAAEEASDTFAPHDDLAHASRRSAPVSAPRSPSFHQSSP